MLMSDVPDDTRTYICEHVFSFEKPIRLVARELDGSLVCTCGCEVEKAHIAGFGHLKERLKQVLDSPMLTPGSHYELINGFWEKGDLE